MSVRKGQKRLKNIASQISDDKRLSSEDKEFLVAALSTYGHCLYTIFLDKA